MAKKQQHQVITLIKESPVSHATKTIEMWKQAIRAFDNAQNPLRTKLYELYEDMLMDGQLEAVWGKRRDNILNRRLTFVRDGVEDEQINTLLNSPDMRNLLEELLNTIGFGYTLIQVNQIEYDEDEEYYHIDFDLIPRAHVHPEKDFECISIDAHRITKDFLYKNPPLSNYMIWAGKPRDKGLFLKIAPYIIYKRGATGDWSQFAEMFGMPFREAVYSAFDDETRQKVDQMLQEWGPGMSFVHPDTVKINLHDTGGSTSSSEVYDRFIQVCDAAIAKAIVGNTLTTEQGENGSYKLGEVHQNEEDSKKQSDEEFVLAVLNTQFRAILKRFGFNVTGGAIWFEAPDRDWEALQKKWEVISEISKRIPVSDSFIYEEFDLVKPEENETLTKNWDNLRTKWEVLSGISQKVPLADDYIYDEFGIPKPENYEELKEEMQLSKFAETNPYQYYNSPMEELQARGIKTTENIFRRIWNFFVKAPKEAMGALNGKALTNTTIDNVSKQLIERVWNKEANYFDAELFETLSKDLLNAIEKGFKSNRRQPKGATNIDIAYGVPDDVMRTAMEQNIFHFSAAKTLAELQSLNQALNESQNYNDFRKKADKITHTFNKTWQKTEYYSAVNCAESASRYNDLMVKN